MKLIFDDAMLTMPTTKPKKPFPFYGAAFKRNPYPAYQQLMSEGQVHPVQFPSGVCGWLVTGYDAAIQVLSDPHIGKNHSLGNAKWRALASIMPEPQHTQLQVHLLHQDPPRHTLMRRLVSSAFSTSRIKGYRVRIECIVNDLIDSIHLLGQADLASSIAAQLPLRVLSEVIGLSDDHRQQFQPQWCKAVQPVGPNDPGRAAYIQLLVELHLYIGKVITESRHGDVDRLIVRLIAAHDSGELNHDELVSTLFQLLVAGQEPVTHQIGNSLLTLLRHPDVMEDMHAMPALFEHAVDELLRFDGAFEISTWRFYPTPTELFGASIPAGDPVIVALNAANHDTSRFTCPRQLQVSRAPNLHLSFGYGRHFCPAASLAKLEIEVTLRLVLQRLRNLRLAWPESELQWIPAVLARGLVSLPVIFTPGRP